MSPNTEKETQIASPTRASVASTAVESRSVCLSFSFRLFPFPLLLPMGEYCGGGNYSRQAQANTRTSERASEESANRTNNSRRVFPPASSSSSFSSSAAAAETSEKSRRKDTKTDDIESAAAASDKDKEERGAIMPQTDERSASFAPQIGDRFRHRQNR